MPYSYVSKEKKSKKKNTKSKETERDNVDEVSQWLSQGDAGSSPPDEGGEISVWQKAGSDNDSLFSFISEAHLQEAQEFRRKGYNSQEPKVDPSLVTKLYEAVTAANSRLCCRASVGGPLDSKWRLEQIKNIKSLTYRLLGNSIPNWVNHELPRKRIEDAGETSLGNRSAAQSLVRRLESTLQTLIGVVYTLCSIDDYSTPEKLHNMLVAELTDALSSGDENTAVIQAQKRMTADVAGNAAWSSLMQTRAAAWEADKPTTFGAMIETTRQEAEKANKKARELKGDSQAFFSDIAAYLQRLSSDLAKASTNVSQSASPRITQKVNDDEVAAPLSRSNTLKQRIKTDLAKKNLQLQAAVAGLKVHAHRSARLMRHGHRTETPSKKPEQVIADSIIRSILWQWQQPAIKIQYASSALLSKVDELQKIEGMILSYQVAHDKENEQEGSDISASYLGEGDMDALVRQWVSDSIEQERPQNQLTAKLAVLDQLLDSDIDHAQIVLARLGNTTESIQKGLERQRLSVNDMLEERLPVDVSPSLWATVDKMLDKFMPDIAKELATAAEALNDALLAVGNSVRNFSEAKTQADKAQLLATKVKESISAESARLTERPLDEHSRGSRLAKHWAKLAKEQNPSNYSPLDAEQVFSSLKKQGLLAGILSTGDPEGYLFATRFAGELESARNDELRLPMSPEQYTALEKDLVEYIVKWGQRRISREGARMVIELSFEHALDTVTFNLSNLFRIPYKVLKASIKIPYNVNKVNNYTMPGHDKPYKAIYGLLGKKLKQLGFNLITAPVPGVVKFAAGAGVTAGAAFNNFYIESREKTFSAVYQRVTEGKRSEKIKMDSPKGMLLDLAIDGTFIAGFKGVRRAVSDTDTLAPDADVTAHPTSVDNMQEPRGARHKRSVLATELLPAAVAATVDEQIEPGSEPLARRVVLNEISDALVKFENDNKNQHISDINSIIFIDKYLYDKMLSADANKIEYKKEWLRSRSKLNVIDNEAVKCHLDFRLVVESYDVYKGNLLKSDMLDPRKELIDNILNLFSTSESENLSFPVHTLENSIDEFERLHAKYHDSNDDGFINQFRNSRILKIAPIYFYLNAKEFNRPINKVYLKEINSYLPAVDAISNNTERSHENIVNVIDTLDEIQNKHREACSIFEKVKNVMDILSVNGKTNKEKLLDAMIMAAQIYDGFDKVSLIDRREMWIRRYNSIYRKQTNVRRRLLHIESIIHHLQASNPESYPRKTKRASSILLLASSQQFINRARQELLHINNDKFTSHLNFKTRKELNNDDSAYYSQFDSYVAEKESNSQLSGIADKLILPAGELFDEVADVKVLSYVYTNRIGAVPTPAPGRVIIIKLREEDSGAIIISNLFFTNHARRISNEEYRQTLPIFTDQSVGNLTHRTFKGPYYYHGHQELHSRLFEILTGVNENEMIKFLSKKDIFIGYPARFSLEYPGSKKDSDFNHETLKDAILGAKVTQNNAAASYLRSANYSLTGPEQIAYQLVPFYQIAHGSLTDREYEINAEEFILNLISAISIVYPALKGIAGTVRSSSISNILRSGLKGSELLKSLSKEVVRLGFDSSKVLGSAMYELAEPFPVNSHLSKTTVFDEANSATKATRFPPDGTGGGLTDFLADIRSSGRKAPLLPTAPPPKGTATTSVTPGPSSAPRAVPHQAINIDSARPKLIEPVLEIHHYEVLSQVEDTLIQETSKNVQQKLGAQYETFIVHPKERCANAAVEVAKALRGSDYTDVRIVELGIWPNGGIDTMPSNHYVVMSKKNGMDIVVDLTAGQFDRYGFSGPIISTKNNWISEWQQKLRDKPRLLAKMAPLRGGITTSPFSMDYVNPQLIVPNGELLQRANWYKRGDHTEQSIQRADFPPENVQPTLPELYNRTREFSSSRSYNAFNIETKTNTKVVTDKLNNLCQDYVTREAIPLDSEGKPIFTVSVIGFGSLARNELLLVSDIDIQIIVVAGEKHVVQARAYSNALLNRVKHEWTSVRSSINNSPEATALEMDIIGGNEGIIVVNSPQAAAEYMKPKKMGAKGYSDIYADSRPIYESEHGTYRAMFDEYEAKLQHTAVNGLVNEALADLDAHPPTLHSAKQTFIRPITLAVGGLYRKLREKLDARLPYETNTLKRAQILKEYGLINQSAYQNIEIVLLRAFKWEQEAGIEIFKHQQQVLSKRAYSSSTRGMYSKTRQIKESLSSANNKINRMPAPSSPSVVRSIQAEGALDNGPGRV